MDITRYTSYFYGQTILNSGPPPPWIYPFELDKLYFTSRTTNLQNLIELNFTETHLNPDFSP